MCSRFFQVKGHAALFVIVIILAITLAFPVKASGRVFDLVLAHTSYNDRSVRLLNIILSHAEDIYGPYNIVKGPKMNRARSEQEMLSGNIHVLWGTYSMKRLVEYRFKPVHGYMLMAAPRICLIEAGTQGKFRDVNSLKDWNRKKLVTGVGAFWSDVPIYKLNNMRIETTAKSKLLYPMTAYGRVDCFNRGAGEVFGNLKKYPEYNLSIEKDLAFIFKGKYSGFLLAPESTELLERFEYGVNKAWEAGAFDSVAEGKISSERKFYDDLNMNDRRLIVLDNPDAYHHEDIRCVNKEFIASYFTDQTF